MSYLPTEALLLVIFYASMLRLSGYNGRVLVPFLSLVFYWYINFGIKL